LGDFHVKKIILPSGKAVEIVYFDALAAGDAPAAAAADVTPAPIAPEHGLECCPRCRETLVYPVDWREAEDGRWELELRCPSCEWRNRGVHDQDAVEAFDDVLNAATDHLIDALEELSRENMREDIERFVAALEGDHILPMDF
jgi:hypothetical protein